MDKIDQRLAQLADAVRTNDPSEEGYEDICEILYRALPDNAKDALQQLVLNGPIYDGDCVSKVGRNLCMDLNLASRAVIKNEDGFTVANYLGARVWRAWQRMPETMQKVQ